MKIKKSAEIEEPLESVRLCEERHDVCVSSRVDYVYGVTMHKGRWVATFHGAGCRAVTGYGPDEMNEDPSLWSRMIHDEDRAAVLDELSKIRDNTEAPPIEHRILSKEGKVRWIRNVRVLHRDGPGGIVSYNGVISDITDRKLAERELERTHNELARKGDDLTATARELRASDEKLRSIELELIQSAKLESVGQLAAGVAHEVKNPLQTILMGLEYLTRNLAGPPVETQEALDEMRQAVTRASIIIHGLLEFAAKGDHETARENLNDCVLRALELVHYELEATRTETVLDLGLDLPLIPIDCAKLEQVFINIFLNATQAMGHGGRMSVATRPDTATPGAGAGKGLVVEVKDTGPGIPEVDLEKVFDPFFTTKTSRTGTGLGLSIVRKIVNLHGGGIKIRNAAGGGAVVTIMLPLCKENEK